jgi:hypothetical protein
LKKVLLILVVIGLIFFLGCESESKADKILIEELEEMQREIDALKFEIRKVEESQQFTPKSCYICLGSGHSVCNTCNGIGNSRYACYYCEGSGTDWRFGTGMLSCSMCDGRGFDQCYSCGGRGRILRYNCDGAGVW